MTRRPLAVVTGASRRVGRAIAIELARTGFDLHLTWNTREADLYETAEIIRTNSPESVLTCSRLDLANADAAQEWAQHAAAHLTTIDVLVHNASSYDRLNFGSLTANDAERHFRVNALSPLLLTQAVRPALRSSVLPGGGVVVWFSDIQVEGRPQKGYVSYGMSKAAVEFLVGALAVELAPEIRVFGVAPGVVAWPEGTSEAQILAYESKIPLGRSGTPEDAARLLRALVLEAPYLTGEIIRIDGGRWLR